MYKLSILLTCLLIQFSSCSQNANDVVIPQPNSIKMTEGTISLGNQITVNQTNAATVLEYLESELENDFKIQTTTEKSKALLNLVVDSTANIEAEGYILNIDAETISITASSTSGAFYGVQTLLQLIRAGSNGDKFNLSCQEIKDSPRFGWRAYMLDESRYFFGEEEVYLLLDQMAKLKMNVFHWHLTDDAGWRIEIKQYPLLTEIGSKRKDTQIGGWKSDKTAGVPHEGFYTQEQIKRIVKYAKARHIKVVPEIEMPGHASATVAAYPWLSTKNQKIEVPVRFGKHYNTYDVIDPRVQKFLKDVVSEVIALFETDVVHIGGDEVRFDYWEEDADMVAYKKAKGYTSFMDIQIEFTNNMSHFIGEQGCSMMGWNEILGKNLHVGEIQFTETTAELAPNVIVHFWKGDLKELAAAAEKGYKLVNSYHKSTYLDYSSISLKDAYSFDPIPEGLDEKYHPNIIGSGCQMWTEWAPTNKDIERKTFPRLAAYAEIGWTGLDAKNYASFLKRLKPIVKEWEKEGIVVDSYDELI